MPFLFFFGMTEHLEVDDLLANVIAEHGTQFEASLSHLLLEFQLCKATRRVSADAIFEFLWRKLHCVQWKSVQKGLRVLFSVFCAHISLDRLLEGNEVDCLRLVDMGMLLGADNERGRCRSLLYEIARLASTAIRKVSTALPSLRRCSSSSQSRLCSIPQSQCCGVCIGNIVECMSNEVSSSL